MNQISVFFLCYIVSLLLLAVLLLIHTITFALPIQKTGDYIQIRFFLRNFRRVLVIMVGFHSSRQMCHLNLNQWEIGITLLARVSRRFIAIRLF